MSDKAIGTKRAGYAGPKEGPFMCSRCVHFHDDLNSCDHPDVKQDAEAGNIPMQKGKPIVDPNGCCTYFRPEERSLGARLIKIR